MCVSVWVQLTFDHQHCAWAHYRRYLRKSDDYETEWVDDDARVVQDSVQSINSICCTLMMALQLSIIASNATSSGYVASNPSTYVLTRSIVDDMSNSSLFNDDGLLDASLIDEWFERWHWTSTSIRCYTIMYIPLWIVVHRIDALFANCSIEDVIWNNLEMHDCRFDHK